MKKNRQKQQKQLGVLGLILVLACIGLLSYTIISWLSTAEKSNTLLLPESIPVLEQNLQETTPDVVQQPQQLQQQKKLQQELLSVFLEKSKELVVIDTTDDRIKERFPLLEEPTEVFFHEPDNTFYIAHAKTYFISVFDRRTGTTEKKIELKSRPKGLVVAKGLLYVLLPDISKVLVIDPLTESIEEEIPVNRESERIVLSPREDRILITSKRPEMLTLINPNIRAIADTITLTYAPFGVTVNPTERYYYITNDRDNHISILPLKGSKRERLVPVELKPHSIVITPNDHLALVTNEGSNTVSVISTIQEKVLATFEVGISPTALAVTLDGKKAYIANSRDRTISVLQVESLKKEKEIVVGENPVEVILVRK